MHSAGECDGRVENVGSTERTASVLIGAMLTVVGLKKRSVGGLLLAAGGVAMIRRGTTGHCELYDKMGINTADQPEGARPRDYFERGLHIDEAVTIQKPLGEVFAFWRKLDNLPRFMEHVKRVEMLDERRSHWVVAGESGKELEWDAEIIDEEPDRLIAWKSLPCAEVDTTGTVHFREAPEGRGTEVRVLLDYVTPAGRLGATAAKLLGRSPGRLVRNDLRRLRELLEAGEPATIDGQSRGQGGRGAGRGMTAAVSMASRIMASTDRPTGGGHGRRAWGGGDSDVQSDEQGSPRDAGEEPMSASPRDEAGGA